MKEINDAVKYETKNWLAQKLIRNFQRKVAALLKEINYQSVHEIGCGQGYNLELLASINPSALISGSDLSEKALRLAGQRNPHIPLFRADVYHLPFGDKRFDLIVASEVLEHLKDPERALREIKRVAKKYALFTVPWEPLWRILNLCRGCYLRSWGNPPGHLNHWSKRGFIKLIAQYFKIERDETSLPWIIVLSRP